MYFNYLIKRKRSLGVLVAILIFSYIYVLLRFSYYDSSRKPSQLQKYIINEDMALNVSINTGKLKSYLQKMNRKRKIINFKKFGPIEDDIPVIAIQVHTDFKRLQYLILSLSQVKGIQTALLIFSHSFYHDSMNRLVRSIDFCKVMQIFYPFSLQLHPDTFPGIDPDDCEPGVKTKKLFCLQRDARLTEHKQHWWWKANFIFKHVKFHKKRSSVLFLEEDNYATPDLLYMFQYVHRSLDYFPYVDIMSMGKPLTNTLDMNLLTVESWKIPYDIGIALNRTTWMKILKAADSFCFYDDYNWSYSLLNLFTKFPRGHAEMVGCMVPRVLSTKGFKVAADIFKTYSKLFRTLNFFPNKVQSVSLFGPRGREERVMKNPRVGSGGWSDVRDQLLCLDPLITTTTNENKYETISYIKPQKSSTQFMQT